MLFYWRNFTVPLLAQGGNRELLAVTNREGNASAAVPSPFSGGSCVGHKWLPRFLDGVTDMGSDAIPASNKSFAGF